MPLDACYKLFHIAGCVMNAQTLKANNTGSARQAEAGEPSPVGVICVALVANEATKAGPVWICINTSIVRQQNDHILLTVRICKCTDVVRRCANGSRECKEKPYILWGDRLQVT